jgi:hypothetical protein
MLPDCERDASAVGAQDPSERGRMQNGEAQVSVTFAAVSSTMTATPGENAAAHPHRHRIPLALGISLAVILVVAALAKPRTVVRLLPRTAAVYAALGLAVNLRGFDFEHVTARFEEAGGGRFLAVEGILRNVARQGRDPPRLRLTLSDANGRSIYFWTASSGIKGLPAGEAAPFRARLAAPPLEAQAVTVDFMPD